MRYLSVCAGIEAASVAWRPLGWTAVAFAEIDRFPSAVLKHHYQEVPNVGDFTAIRGDEYGAIDLLVGGTPCQDFSVAGLRAGMDGARGQLTVEFARLAARLRPRWLVWENVPGVLSIDRGRAFGTFLGLLGECGYGFAYRVLDAQFFGVPQRRRRVFVVGHLGDWRRAAAVLFERHSLSGHPPPRREARENAPTIPSRRTGGGGLGAEWPTDVAPTLNAHFGDKWGLEDQHALNGAGLFVPDMPIYATDGQSNAAFAIDIALGLNATHEQPYIAHSLRADGFDASEDGTGRGTPLVPVAFTNRGIYTGDSFETLRAGSHGALPTVAHNMAVRRLTARECERLQGFPDDYTKIRETTADGPRYKALGNSMAVPVMRWIGERIQMVEAI